MQNNRSKTQRILTHISVLLVGVMIGSVFTNAFYSTAQEDLIIPIVETTQLITYVPEVTDDPVDIEEVIEEEPLIDYVVGIESLRYGFTEEDIYLLATLLCGSKDVSGDGEYDFDYGNDERYDQISLVLCVVMNRVRDSRFPNTVEEVVWANNGSTWQFHVMQKWSNTYCEVSDIALQRVREWCKAYDNYDIGIQSIPEDHIYFYGDGKENHSRP